MDIQVFRWESKKSRFAKKPRRPKRDKNSESISKRKDFVASKN